MAEVNLKNVQSKRSNQENEENSCRCSKIKQTLPNKILDQKEGKSLKK